MVALLASSVVEAQPFNPATTFYAMDYADSATPHGSFSALSITAPFTVLRTLPRSRMNGSLTLDPTRGLIYGGSCCSTHSTIEAYDASLMAPVTARDITLTTTGSVSMEVDAVRRELFVYDTVARTLRAVSLEETTYGQLTATVTLTGLPAEPTPTSVGDMVAIDTRTGHLFVTGGDGGPLLSVNIAGITGHTGDFGDVVATGSTARRSGNSAGAVAIDVAGRRVFFIPTTGTVRVISADAPYAMIRDITIAGQGGNDCGLFYDNRTDNLYVGRGTGTLPVVVALSTGTVTPINTGAGNTYGLSFAGAGAACPATGSCTACTAPGGCPSSAPVCESATGLCRGCTADTDCALPVPACLPSGACGVCSATNARACTASAPVCSEVNTCVVCTATDATACASSADGHTCQTASTGAFCGCAADADCGGATSGRICDATTRRCADGCGAGSTRNGCPTGRFCSSDDATGARTGVCTTTCNFDGDCMRTMPTLPLCLAASDAGASLCVACRADADCASASDGRAVCDAAMHACVQCTATQRTRCNANTVGSACLTDGRCGCSADSDCSAARVCDSAMHVCLERPDAGPPPDVTTDVGADVVADVSVDGATDAPSDVATDAAADVAADVAVDVAADGARDAASDVAANDVAVNDVAVNDVGPADTGVDAVTDLGATQDVPGPVVATDSGGCGCAVPGGGRSNALAVWSVLAALAARRRSRRVG